MESGRPAPVAVAAPAPGPATRAGGVERTLQRFYERYGSGGSLLLAMTLGLASVGVAALMVVAVPAAFLEVPTSKWWTWVWLGQAVGLGGAAIGLFLSREVLRTVAGWSRGRSVERASQVWTTIESAPRAVITRNAVIVAAIACLTVVPFWISDADAPAYTALLVIITSGVIIASDALFTIFLAELILRPVAEDVGRFLPRGFEPALSGWRLRTKAVLPVPALIFSTAVVVGAFSDIFTGPARFVMTFGVALVVGAGATALYLVVTRTILRPIEELGRATERVRAGDLDSPAPLLGADDLGELTTRFNQMLEGLREREELAVRNVALDASLAESVRALEASQVRIVAAADESRRQVERDLHDGAQQTLLLLALKLRTLSAQVERGAAKEQVAAVVEDAIADAECAHRELRDLAHGIYPIALETGGLEPALAQAAKRASIPVEIEADGIGRYEPAVEAAVYFCCLEALQNAAKHAGPGAVARVSLADRDDALQVEVSDDGLGFEVARAGESSGLQNMTDRIGAVGGTVALSSTPGVGTHAVRRCRGPRSWLRGQRSSRAGVSGPL